MEKIRSKEAIAARLKEKETEINRHIEALQHEVLSTGTDIKEYITQNVWVGLAGAIAAGILVGLIAGKRRRPGDSNDGDGVYAERLADLAREAGADEKEVAFLLRQALRAPVQPAYTAPQQKKSSGIGRMLMGMAADMAIGFAKKSLINILDDRIHPPGGSDRANTADSGD